MRSCMHALQNRKRPRCPNLEETNPSILNIELFFRAEDASLYEELKQTHADYIPLHLAQLKVLDESKVKCHKINRCMVFI